jgi:lysozyme
MQSNLNYFEALGISPESARNSSHCSIGECGMSLLRIYEGCSLTPYRCPAGIWTIGYGHAIGRKLPIDFQYKISIFMAEQLLHRDAEIAWQSAVRLGNAALQSYQYDALASFIFNLGSGAFQRSTLRRAIQRDEVDAIAHEWMRWVWAGGRKLPGLVKRRTAELQLFLNGTC